MALNQTEKDLLAVVKYYNDNKKGVARLVNKLADGFDLNSVSHLTGFSVNEIGDILDASPKPKPRKSRAKNAQPIEPDPVIAKVEETKPKAINLTSESPLPERVAYEMTMRIGALFKSGEKFMGQKAAMAEFQCTAATVAEAFKLLVANNWIEQAEPGNFRKGYVVK